MTDIRVPFEQSGIQALGQKAADAIAAVAVALSHDIEGETVFMKWMDDQKGYARDFFRSEADDR